MLLPGTPMELALELSSESDRSEIVRDRSDEVGLLQGLT